MFAIVNDCNTELPTSGTKTFTKHLNEELLTHLLGMGLGTGRTKQNTCFARNQLFLNNFETIHWDMPTKLCKL